MAADGTGGIVYRKIVDGRPTSSPRAPRTAGGSPPQRLDVGQSFDSSWPRIARRRRRPAGGRSGPRSSAPAATGCSRPRSIPGAKRFQAPVPIDLNIGEANATHPSIAMNSGGTAYLAYRVLTSSGSVVPRIRGRRRADRALQRLAVVGRRHRSTATRPCPWRPRPPPTRPKVGIDVTGNGLVAWQEPDDDFVDRVWAPAVVRLESRHPAAGQPADVRRRAAARARRCVLAGRDGLRPGCGRLPPAAGARQRPGRSARVREHDPGGVLRQRGQVRRARGSWTARREPRRPARSALPRSASPRPATSPPSTARAAARTGLGIQRGRRQAAAAGRRPRRGGRQPVGRGCRQRLGRDRLAGAHRQPRGPRTPARGQGTHPQRRHGAAPGPIGDVLVAGSGLGDAVAGFRQGDSAGRIAAAIVNAPPLEFEVQTPDLVRALTTRADPMGPSTERDRQRALSGGRCAGGSCGRVCPGGPCACARGTSETDGTPCTWSRVDSAGQETDSLPATLKIDRRHAARPDHDGRGGRSGCACSTARAQHLRTVGVRTSISFGDGRRARGKARARHVYRKPGSYRLRSRRGTARATA